MTEPIRVLVVDDSAAVRRVIQMALAGEPDLMVAGTASTGAIALAKIPQLAPDVVTLDIEMPPPDGLETLVEIRRRYPALPVVMVSSFTHRGAEATLDALARGASDYVQKPTHAGNVEEAIARMREALLPRLRALVRVSSTDVLVQEPAVAPSDGGIDIVALACSTGGPAVLHEVIPALPEDFPLPVLVVQHMPPMFTALLAERLDAQSHLPVREAVSGEPLLPGQVWIAPGDHHLLLNRVEGRPCLLLNQGMPENSCRPAADVLFRSVAEHFSRRALGVVLTGMGQDGLRGSESIVSRGGRVWAQDQASSVVWGMPGFVTRAGLSRRSVRPAGLAKDLVDEAGIGRDPPRNHAGDR